MPKQVSSLSFSVENGQLQICSHEICNYRIRVWPRPVAEARNGGYWERFYPEFRMIAYPLPKARPQKDSAQMQLGFDLSGCKAAPAKPTKKQAYDQLRQTLPPSYAFALAPFKSHQWNMIVFLSFHRRFYELIKSNPAIAFLLANRRDFNWKVYRKEISLEQLTGMKQQALLELLSLPGSKSLVQFTKKIQPPSVNLELPKLLHFILRNPDTLKRLSHLKKINAGVLSLLAINDDLLRHTAPQLVEEISLSRSNNHFPVAVHQLRESVRWNRELHPGRKLPTFRNLEDLAGFHEELLQTAVQLHEQAAAETGSASRTERLEMIKMMNRQPLPRPPLPGSESIVPITSVFELKLEGNRQRNCVGTYEQAVRSGSCSIYRVLQPERATLSIVRNRDGQWKIGELYGSCNRTVDNKTRLAVADWLKNVQLGI